jgi:hypothetical protein
MKIQRKVLIECNEVKRLFSSTFLEVYVDDNNNYYFVSYDEVIAIVKNVTEEQIEFIKNNKNEQS